MHAAGKGLSGKRVFVVLSQCKDRADCGTEDSRWVMGRLGDHFPPVSLKTRLFSSHYFIFKKAGNPPFPSRATMPTFWVGGGQKMKSSSLPRERGASSFLRVSAHITKRRREGTRSTCWVPNKAQFMFPWSSDSEKENHGVTLKTTPRGLGGGLIMERFTATERRA